MTWPVFTGATDPIWQSNRESGSLWAHYSGIFSDLGEKVMVVRGGMRKPKKALFSLSRCAKTQPCCSIPFSRSVKTISGFLCGLVHWSHAVFPPSKSAVLSPKWFAYFPCNTRLKKDERKSRGKGEPLLLYLDLHAASWRDSLKVATV